MYYSNLSIWHYFLVVFVFSFKGCIFQLSFGTSELPASLFLLCGLYEFASAAWLHGAEDIVSRQVCLSTDLFSLPKSLSLLLMLKNEACGLQGHGGRAVTVVASWTSARELVFPLHCKQIQLLLLNVGNFNYPSNKHYKQSNLASSR